MKMTSLIIGAFLLSNIHAETIDLEHFKHLSPTEQDSAIEKASPELKAKLNQLRVEVGLRSKYGGDEGYREHQQNRAIVGRGFGYLFTFSTLQTRIWNRYMYQQELNAKSLKSSNKVALKQKSKVLEQLNALGGEQDAVVQRLQAIYRPLLVSLAPSAGAAALEEKVKAVVISAQGQSFMAQSTNVTREEVAAMDKFSDSVIEEMRRLPSLTPSEIQKEIDSLPLEELHR